MARPDKVQAVADIKERLESASAVFLAEYAGLSVAEQQALRRGLRSNEAEFKVVKMSLARRAAADLGLAELDELLSGPTALTFADGDPVPAAKALKDFSADHAALLIKGGLIGGDFLPPEKVSQLAEIEPRDVLLAKMAGAMQAPAARVAGLLAALLRNSASVFKQLLEQKESAAPAPEPAAEAAAEQPEPEAAAEPAAEASGEAEVVAAPEEEVEAAAEQPEPEAAAEPAPEAEADAAPEAGAAPEQLEAEATPAEEDETPETTAEAAPADSDPVAEASADAAEDKTATEPTSAEVDSSESAAADPDTEEE